jgi:hypothetical protein
MLKVLFTLHQQTLIEYQYLFNYLQQHGYDCVFATTPDVSLFEIYETFKFDIVFSNAITINNAYKRFTEQNKHIKHILRVGQIPKLEMNNMAQIENKVILYNGPIEQVGLYGLTQTLPPIINFGLFKQQPINPNYQTDVVVIQDKIDNINKPYIDALCSQTKFKVKIFANKVSPFDNVKLLGNISYVNMPIVLSSASTFIHLNNDKYKKVALPYEAVLCGTKLLTNNNIYDKEAFVANPEDMLSRINDSQRDSLLLDHINKQYTTENLIKQIL